MPDQEPVVPADGPDTRDARLPVPVQDRRPVARSSRAVAVDRPDALARAVVGAPLVAASVVGAAAAAAMTGAAVASRLLWQWTGLRGLLTPGEKTQSPASWDGPGVHISYTHVEVHWPRPVRRDTPGTGA